MSCLTLKKACLTFQITFDVSIAQYLKTTIKFYFIGVFMQFKTLLLTSALLTSSYGFSEFVDKTESFKGFFTSKFIGSSSEGADTWDMTYCVVRNPATGGCIERSGYKIKGEGHGTVTEMTSFGGRGVSFDYRRSPWDTAPAVIAPWIDVNMVFTYAGSTQGRKQCYPGNFFCGYEWENIDPQGRIEIFVTCTPDGVFNVEVRYAVIGGNPDKPNAVVANAMNNLRERARFLVEAWLRGESVGTPVVLK
jgi:hypothetical protein